jgi:predicted MFS family arabinose efflux permease
LRAGAVLNAIALLAEALLLSSGAPYWGVFPAFFAYGFSGGIVSSQINQVLLYDIKPEKTGAASGINTTGRQIATALGVATMTTIFATMATNHDAHDALLPSMLVGFVAFVISAAVTFRLPQIRVERRSTPEELIDDFALVDPIDPRAET